MKSIISMGILCGKSQVIYSLRILFILCARILVSNQSTRQSKRFMSVFVDCLRLT